MGFVNAVKSQFMDVIEFEDVSNKLLVYKFRRPTGGNELKQGSKVIVREGQVAAFLKGGQLADIIQPGTVTLNTDNFPVLSSLNAFPFLFTSPVISDVYFISTRQLLDNKWATKTPILKRDPELNMVRVRAFGKFAFHIIDVPAFIREVFGSKGLVMTYDIVQYLSSMVTEAFAEMIGETKLSIMDLAVRYRDFSSVVQSKVNEMSKSLGIEFTNVLIESLNFPEEVEKLIDEQSGIGMASRNMQTFMQYQTARAMRDASKQEGGLAGLGAGIAAGKAIADSMGNTFGNDNTGKIKADKLREIKALLDEGILTQDEFDMEKKKILNQ